MAALDTGDTANLVCFRRLEHHHRLFEDGRQGVSTYPLAARIRFGDGRLGEVRHAADTPLGTAENRGKFSASVLDADFPALSRKGSMEALAGQLDFPRDAPALRKQGATIPLRVNRMGRYFLTVVDFSKDESREVRGPVVLASDFEWAVGGLRLPMGELPNGGACARPRPMGDFVCPALRTA